MNRCIHVRCASQSEPCLLRTHTHVRIFLWNFYLHHHAWKITLHPFRMNSAMEEEIRRHINKIQTQQEKIGIGFNGKL